MSKALESVSGTGQTSFELDRLEMIDGCWKLEGRWSGVRGRRFMRPALNLVVDGQPVRLLADLAHKPWAAEEGEPWQAAFPCSVEGDWVEAELTVAPDIMIQLPAPRETARTRKRPPEAQRRLQRQLDRAGAEKAQATARMDDLLGQLSQAISERKTVEDDRDRAAVERDALRDELAEVTAERDAARQERDRVAAEREAAIVAREELESERDSALKERGRSLNERGEADSERDQALAERDAALGERNAAVIARDTALSERDAALTARGEALAQRDGALTERDEALAARDELSRANERLESEVAHHASAHGAALVMRRATQEPSVRQPHAGLVPRALAVIVLLAIVVVLLIVLRVA